MGLNKKQVEGFRQRLLELQVQLNRRVQGTSKEVQSSEQPKGYSQHQADEGTADFDRMLSLQVSDGEIGVLRQIDRALEKIDEGTFGVCDVSGQEIPLKRLEAIPYATMTVQAQEELEKGAV